MNKQTLESSLENKEQIRWKFFPLVNLTIIGHIFEVVRKKEFV
jgi:hypothetical protein